MSEPVHDNVLGVRNGSHRPPSTESVVKGYLDDLALALGQIEVSRFSDLVAAVVAELRSGGRVYVAGNGGSSTTATHIASDLSTAAASLPKPPLVRSLTENMARITAIANDHSYEEIFSRQLTDEGLSGGLLLLLSVSGNSPNLVAAAEAARARGITVLAVLGHPGRLAGLADHAAVFGLADYGLAEDLHLALGHVIVRTLRGGMANRVVDR